jgi:hypothetical protein
LLARAGAVSPVGRIASARRRRNSGARFPSRNPVCRRERSRCFRATWSARRQSAGVCGCVTGVRRFTESSRLVPLRGGVGPGHRCDGPGSS